MSAAVQEVAESIRHQAARYGISMTIEQALDIARNALQVWVCREEVDS